MNAFNLLITIYACLAVFCVWSAVRYYTEQHRSKDDRFMKSFPKKEWPPMWCYVGAISSKSPKQTTYFFHDYANNADLAKDLQYETDSRKINDNGRAYAQELNQKGSITEDAEVSE